MRLVHVFVAIGIASWANSIEAAWLGYIVLITTLAGYTWLAIRIQKPRSKE